LTTTSETWNRTIKPYLLRILRVQQIFVFAGVLLYAFLSALHIHISLSFLMVCVLVIGNLNYGLQAASGPLSADSTLALAPGDRLLFFTDGVTEANIQKKKNSATRALLQPREMAPVLRPNSKAKS
jgi:hypothetical protein